MSRQIPQQCPRHAVSILRRVSCTVAEEDEVTILHVSEAIVEAMGFEGEHRVSFSV